MVTGAVVAGFAVALAAGFLAAEAAVEEADAGFFAVEEGFAAVEVWATAAAARDKVSSSAIDGFIQSVNRTRDPTSCGLACREVNR